MNTVDAGKELAFLQNIQVESILWAVCLLVVCIIAIKIVVRLLRRAIEKTPLNRTLAHFIIATIRFLLYAIATLIAADKLGIPIASLVAVFSVAGLAFSLAIQDSLTNLFSGLTILITRPFIVGDYVEVGGMSGTVDSIGLIYTRLLTTDNKQILLPNREISSGKIINYTNQASRRVEIRVSAPYVVAAEQVKLALLAAAEQVAHLPDPAPFSGMMTYGASGIEYVLRLWVNAADYWTAYFALMERVKEQFDARGIEIPYNKLDVTVNRAPEKP